MSSHQYPIEITVDGSPTLKHAEGETMHNREGAFSESLYIYLEAISKSHALSPQNCHTLSLGLGLGYNEMLWAAYGITNKGPSQNWSLHSYESEAHLSQAFLNWCYSLNNHSSHSLSAAYDHISQRVSSHFHIEPTDIKKELIQQIEEKTWTLYGALHEDIDFTTDFHCILYDAYSTKTSPQLWNEEFLNNFLSKATAKTCVFSTYAAQGGLKRALKKQQFQVFLRPGFGGKRQCTWAIKGHPLNQVAATALGPMATPSEF